MKHKCILYQNNAHTQSQQWYYLIVYIHTYIYFYLIFFFNKINVLTNIFYFLFIFMCNKYTQQHYKHATLVVHCDEPSSLLQLKEYLNGHVAAWQATLIEYCDEPASLLYLKEFLYGYVATLSATLVGYCDASSSVL